MRGRRIDSRVPRVDARRRLVDVAPAEGHQPHGEIAHRLVVEVDGPLAYGARTTVGPDGVGAVDEHVGDARVGDEGREHPELGWEAAVGPEAQRGRRGCARPHGDEGFIDGGFHAPKIPTRRVA